MKLKKITSGVISTAMVLSTVQSAMAATDEVYDQRLNINAEGTTSFEIEDFYPYFNDFDGYIVDAENSSGGKIWSSSYWNSGSDTYSQTINVNEAGDYEVSFVCMQKCSNLSLLTLSIDPNTENEQIICTNDNYPNGNWTNIAGLFSQEAGWTDGNQVFHRYSDYLCKYTKVVNLTEGVHTVFLDMPAGQGTNRCASAIDNLTFTKIEPTLPLDIPAQGGVFEVEDVFSSLGTPLIDVEGASGGKLLFTSSGSAADPSQTINVAEEGYYKIHFPMINQNQYNNFSTVAFRLNDALLFNNAYNNPYDKTATGVRCLQQDWTQLYDYTYIVYLAKGENTISLTMKQNMGRDAFGFDYLQFERLETPSISVNTVAVTNEFEDLFDWASSFMVSEDNASGGKYVKMNDYKNELIADMATLNVANSGVYKVNFVTEYVDKNYSQVSLDIDDNAVLTNVGSTSNFTKTNVTAHGALLDYYANVYLAAGSHDLKINYVKGATASPRHAMAFDTLTITPQPALSLPSIGATFESEDIFGLQNINSDTNASGGQYTFNSWGSQSNEYLIGEIDVEENGYFDVELLTTGVNSSVSAAVLYVDDIGIIYSSKNGIPNGTICEPAYPQAQNEAFNIFSHVTGTPLFLNKGKHIVKLMYNPSAAGGNVVKYALDCIKFTPYGKEVNYVSDLADLAQYPFYIGDGSVNEWPVGVYVEGDGNALQNGDKYQITYASSNENVLLFNADGVVSVLQTGYSDLSIVLASNGTTLAAFKERVFVLSDEYNRIIRNAEYKNNSVSFEAVQIDSNLEEKGFDGIVIAAAYNNGKLVSTQVVNLNNAQTKYNAAITGSGINSVKIFTLDPKVELRPIWYVTEVL